MAWQQFDSPRLHHKNHVQRGKVRDRITNGILFLSSKDKNKMELLRMLTASESREEINN